MSIEVERKKRPELQNNVMRFDEGCFYRVAKATVFGGAAGALLGAGRLSWYPDPYRFDMKNTRVAKNLGMTYVIRNLQPTVLYSAIVCGVYTAVDCFFENLRDENKQSTYVNSTLAGMAAGMVMGTLTRRLDIMATSALGVGLVSGVMEFNGQTHYADAKHAQTKWWEILPPQSKETDELKDLKEKYPEFKHL